MNDSPEPPNVSEQQLRLIYENIHDLVFLVEVLDAGRYRVQSVSRSYLKRTGLEATDIVGRQISEVLKPDDVDYVRQRYDAAIARASPIIT
ncbi:MAG: PAS domain S-box protein [Gammaproteobacteria bacterium]|nr:PAS domain S-box protein [Gammaproteobacteria bacterium]